MHTAKSAHEHTGSAEAVRPSLRNGFTAYIVLSPARPGLLVTVIPKKRELLANLTPAIGASGPHDFAVRFTRRSSKAHPRPPLPAPTSVTMANVPSSRDGMARDKQVIWVRSQELFLKIRNDGVKGMDTTSCDLPPRAEARLFHQRRVISWHAHAYSSATQEIVFRIAGCKLATMRLAI
jgi:hypothetical protein